MNLLSDKFHIVNSTLPSQLFSVYLSLHKSNQKAQIMVLLKMISHGDKAYCGAS